MSIWICPRCEENGVQSHHLYGQTKCKRCGYEKGSDARLEAKTAEREKDIDEYRKILAPLFFR